MGPQRKVKEVNSKPGTTQSCLSDKNAHASPSLRFAYARDARRRSFRSKLASRPATAGSRHAGSTEGHPASPGRTNQRTRDCRQWTPSQTGARVHHRGRAVGRARSAHRRERHLRFHRIAGGPIYAHRLEERFREPLVRPAAAAPGGNAAPARRRPAVEGDRIPIASRRRRRRPCVRRRWRADGGRHRPRHALPIFARRQAAHTRRHGADRRQRPVPRVGVDARRLLHQRRHTPRGLRTRRWPRGQGRSGRRHRRVHRRSARRQHRRGVRWGG